MTPDLRCTLPLALAVALGPMGAAARPESTPVFFAHPEQLIEHRGLDVYDAPALSRALVELMDELGDAVPPTHRPTVRRRAPGDAPRSRPGPWLVADPRDATQRAERALEGLRNRAGWRRALEFDARVRRERAAVTTRFAALRTNSLAEAPAAASDAAFDAVARAVRAAPDGPLTGPAFAADPAVRHLWYALDDFDRVRRSVQALAGDRWLQALPPVSWWALSLEVILSARHPTEQRLERRTTAVLTEPLAEWPARRALITEPRWLAEAILARLRHDQRRLSVTEGRAVVADLLRATHAAPGPWRTSLRRTLRSTLARMPTDGLPPLTGADAVNVAAALATSPSPTISRLAPVLRAHPLDPATRRLLDWLGDEPPSAADAERRIFDDLGRWPAAGEALPADLPPAPYRVPAPPAGRMRLVWLDEGGGVQAAMALPADARPVPLPGAALIVHGPGDVERIAADPSGAIERRPLPEPLASALLDRAVEARLHPDHPGGEWSEPWRPRPRAPTIGGVPCGGHGFDFAVSRSMTMRSTCAGDPRRRRGPYRLDIRVLDPAGMHFWCDGRLYRLEDGPVEHLADLSATPSLVQRPGPVRAAVGPGALTAIEAATGRVRRHRFDP